MAKVPGITAVFVRVNRTNRRVTENTESDAELTEQGRRFGSVRFVAALSFPCGKVDGQGLTTIWAVTSVPFCSKRALLVWAGRRAPWDVLPSANLSWVIPLSWT